MVIKGADIVCEVLREQGVELVFGYPGASVLSLYDSLYKHRATLRHIITAHEQGAAHAADGYARSTGKTGVCVATSGPGATNLVTGIAAAYMDSVPMVVITGNVATDMIGRDSFQEVFITGITLPVTKHNFLVKDVRDLANTLRRAFVIAGRGRKGPVLVDIPKDLLDTWTDFISKEKPPQEPPQAAAPDDIRAIADCLNAAKRPIVQFGGGVVSSGAADVLITLLRRGDIPACHTLMSAGALSCDDPLSLGMAGMHGSRLVTRAVAEADVLLAIGTRFSERVVTSRSSYAERAVRLQIDVDRCEVNKNVFVDRFAIGDARATLEALLPMIEQKKRPEWSDRINELRSADSRDNASEDALPPENVMAELCKIAGEDAIFTTDVGQHQMWAAQSIRRLHPRSFLTSGGLGAMGYGYGAAIGAQLAFPKRRVFHITGDGSFHMNLIEACTAVKYDLPIITVIMNNSALGMVRQWQKLFLGERYSETEPEWKTDFVKVAEGFGVAGYRVRTLEELRTALGSAVASQKTAWIECVIDREALVLPMIPPDGAVAEE